MTEIENQQNEQKKGISYSKLLIGFLLLLIPVALFLPRIRLIDSHHGSYTQCQCNQKFIGTALEMYSTDNNLKYPENLNLLMGNYLKTIPTCSKARKDTYSATYQVYNNPENKIYRFTYYCGGHYHQNAGVPENYPQYTSERGLMPR